MNKNNLWILLFLAIMVPIGYGNLMVEKKSIMEDSIQNPEDPFLIMDQEVKDVFPRAEGIRIIYKFEEGEISAQEDLIKIEELHYKLEKRLPKMTIASLANVRGYEEIDDTLYTVNYMDFSDQFFLDTEDKFKINKWKEVAKVDTSIVPALLDRELKHAIFIVYPPDNYKEMEAYREIAEALEEREISKLEWLFKNDIIPTDSNILVSGWVIGRGIIDGSLNVDILRLVGFLGITFVFFAFFAFTRSLRQAFIASLLIVGMGIVWTRGCIGLIDQFLFEMKEQVYVLLAYTNCIVQGISFSLHMFHAYNEIKGKKHGFDEGVTWKMARRQVISSITATAVIALTGFLTLYNFQVEAIQNLGLLSALGIINLWFLAIIFLPAWHMVIGGKYKKRSNKFFQLSDKFYDKGIEFCLRSINVFPKKLRDKSALSVVILFILIALGMIWSGKLIIGSKPLEYTPGTAIDKSAQYLNKENNPGFDVVDVFIEPSNKEDIETPVIYDVAYANKAWELSKKIKRIEGVREVVSILDLVERISEKSYEKSFPDERSLIAYAYLFYINNGLPLDIAKQMYDDHHGIRLAVNMDASSSIEIGRICQEIVELGNEYEELDVKTFGKLSQYPQVDNYITMGKPWNVLYSQIAVIVLCAIWVFITIRKTDWPLKNRVLTSTKTGIVMSVPFIFSTAAILIVMMLFKVPLDISSSAIGSMAISAAIDFSIYFVYEYIKEVRKGRNHEQSLLGAMFIEGKAILGDSINNQLCFVVLMFSVFIPIFRIGWMMVAMLIFATIGSLIIMPPMLGWAFKEVIPKSK